MLSKEYLEGFYKKSLDEYDASRISQFRFKKGEWDKYKNDNIRVTKNDKGGYGYYFADDPKKTIHSLAGASEESKKVFDEIYDYLVNDLNKKEEDIYYGGKGQREFYLFDEKEKKPIWYDFVVFPEKIIIEFHGEAYHPHKGKLSDKEWEEWSYPKDGRSADIVFVEDKKKEKLAKDEGFDYYIIWAKNDVQKNIDKVKEIFNK